MDMVLTAIERTALPKRMLYSDFVGGPHDRHSLWRWNLL
jgi:CRP-like cAMP-binding protein